MPKMQIVTDAMLNRAEIIGRSAESILSSQNAVTQTFQNMGHDFSGRVPGLMIRHMTSMESDYKTMNNILNNYKTFMEDAARNYEWTEDELARWAESLGNGQQNSASSSSSSSSSSASTSSTSTGDNSAPSSANASASTGDSSASSSANASASTGDNSAPSSANASAGQSYSTGDSGSAGSSPSANPAAGSSSVSQTNYDNPREFIRDFLREKIGNDYGVAALMGNLQAESGLSANNLQNSYERSIGLGDDEYTSAFDSGSYNNFVNDSAGYGLAQWTYYSRKQGLIDYAREKGTSIGDLLTQLEYLWKELTEGYKGVLDKLRNATSIREASDAVLKQFERPADQSDRACAYRASLGENIYNELMA